MEEEKGLSERILAFIQTKEITPGILADRIGVQRSGISHILSGRNKPSFDFIQKFLEAFPEVNAEWFITGRGGMLKEVLQQDLFATSGEQPSGISGIPVLPGRENTASEASVQESGTERPEKGSEPAEALKKDENARIVKVVLLYDDGHFTSYSPGPDREGF